VCNNEIGKLDKRQLKTLIERLVPFEELTDVHTGRPIDIKLGTCFCLFHDNKNSPAAKWFHDEDGITRLQCWSCNKQFTSYDYITKIQGQDPLKIIGMQFTEKELKDILKILRDTGSFDKHIDDFSKEIHNKWVDSDEDLSTFLDDLYFGYTVKEVREEIK